MKNNWPDNLTIQQYLEGTLDKKLMHELEKKALDDPFLADALEGYAHSAASSHGLSMLQRQLHERIAHQQENKKVFDLSWQRLSVAAAAAVMFISAGVLFWMNSQLPDKQIAATHKQVEVNLAPVDTFAKDQTLVANQAAEAKEAKSAAINAARSVARPSFKSKATARIDDNAAANVFTAKEAVVSSNDVASATAMQEEHAEAVAAANAASRTAKTIAAKQAIDPKLSEVIVSRLSPTADYPATPADGWEVYRKYLHESVAKASAKLKEKGVVIVGVKLDREGKINDLKIEKSLSAAADSLALQIIRSGPAWKPAMDGTLSAVSVDIIF
ncbi:hypothetical protein GZH53_11220 [Flavihumibacter sp. R14]|nr:hypothetical protein [Flavihumibacter soli]